MINEMKRFDQKFGVFIKKFYNQYIKIMKTEIKYLQKKSNFLQIECRITLNFILNLDIIKRECRF